MNSKWVEGGAVEGAYLPFEGGCRWLLSLDYDGTLRNCIGPQMPEHFFDTIRALRRQGVRWGINTGRSLPFLMDDFLLFAPYLPDFVCTCERYVYMANGQGKLCPLREHNERCMRHNEELLARHERSATQGFKAMRESVAEGWHVDPYDAFAIIAEDAHIMDALMPKLRHLVSGLQGLCIQRAGRFMRFSDARYHKGTALECVAKHWGIAEHALVIMGDGHNDIDAFAHFPQAFRAAPAECDPEVQAYLHAHAGHLSTGGVLEALHYWRQHRMGQHHTHKNAPPCTPH